MRYAGLIKEDFENGTGVGCTLFVQGCNRHCPGCFNPETWDFNGGFEFTEDVKYEIFEQLKKRYISRFTLLGGEPLSKNNIRGSTKLLAEIATRFPKISIWVYSSYTFEEILDDEEKFNCIMYADILVDGRFVESKKSAELKFRGSSNQRIIDIWESIRSGGIKLLQ